MRVWRIRREGSFPSQFYGETYDGVFFYGRYRHGVLTIGVSPHSEEAAIQRNIAAPDWLQDDGTGSGVMELEEFLRRVREAGLTVLSSLEPVPRGEPSGRGGR